MKTLFNASLLRRTTILLAGICTLAASASANTVSVTFLDAPTGINDGLDYVLPYLINMDGIPTRVICYDLFDEVTRGQSWTANQLTLSQAAGSGQFSSAPGALAAYSDIAFLSQQKTTSPQNQIDLQHDMWNVFAPGTYAVTTGMQAYLDLLTTSAYKNFDFSQVAFLEDVSQSHGRAQAFVFAAPVSTPEPATMALFGAGVAGLAVMARKPRACLRRSR